MRRLLDVVKTPRLVLVMGMHGNLSSFYEHEHETKENVMDTYMQKESTRVLCKSKALFQIWK